MSRLRAVGTIAASFLVSQILAIVVHGVILARDYGPFYGTLLRSTSEPDWRVLLFPIPHLLFVAGLVWIAVRWPVADSPVRRGLALGGVGWLLGSAPLWITWWVEQPWPDTLLVKQLGLELISSLAVGLTIARLTDAHVHRRATAPAVSVS